MRAPEYPAGATQHYDLQDTFHATGDGLLTIAAPVDVEARAGMLLGERVADIVGGRTLPALGGAELLGLYTTMPSTVVVTLRGNNGVYLEQENVAVLGLTLVDPSTLFSTPILPGMQFRTTDVGTFLLHGNAILPGLVFGPTTYFVPFVDSSSITFAANPDPTAIDAVVLQFLKPGANNTANPVRVMDIINGGTTILTDPIALTFSTGTGALRVAGSARDGTIMPLYQWTLTNDAYVPGNTTALDTAVGWNTTGTNTFGGMRRDVVWSGLTGPSTVALVNHSSAPNTATLLREGEDGALLDTTTVTLLPYSTTVVGPASGTGVAQYRYRLQVADSAGYDTPVVSGIVAVTVNGHVAYLRGCAVTRAVPVAQYDVTATIQVSDHGGTFQQVTHPSIGTVAKLLNVNNPDALVGSHGFDCTPSPDAVVNTISKLLANYALLTPAEQEEFSGDRAGFAPFALNGCDASTTQYVLFISIVVARAAAAPTVTGEQYVTKWLDPLQTQYFYLSNTEVHDMLNGTPEIPSFARQLAAVLGPATGNDPASMESLLRGWVDGNPANGEFYSGFDPLNIDLRSPGGIRFYMAPDGRGASDFTIDSTALLQTFAVIREFLRTRTQSYPALYGGSAATGPSLSFNPTWSTQDPN